MPATFTVPLLGAFPEFAKVGAALCSGVIGRKLGSWLPRWNTVSISINWESAAIPALKSTTKIPSIADGDASGCGCITMAGELCSRRPSRGGAAAGTWNGMIGRRSLFLEAARRAGGKTLYFEDAPLPGFVACDPQGINYGNSLPRQASFYRQWADSRPSERRSRQWKELGDYLPQRPAKRPQSYADSGSSGRQSPAGHFLYCPLQVPVDTQVWAFGGWIRSMDHFIEVVYQASRALPAGWHLRIREHPSSRRSFGKKLRALQDERFMLWNQGTSKSQIEAAEAVVTLNSSVGLHGFLFDKPVIVLGQAYWSFEALTTPVKCVEALGETFSRPTKLDYDDAARSDFMNYLVSEYLIHLPAEGMGKPFDLPSSELVKIAKYL